MRKRFFALVLSVLLTLQPGVSQTFAAAAPSDGATVEESYNTGLEPLELIELDEEELEQSLLTSGEEDIQTANSYDWESYSNDYCYNNMTTAQQNLYDGLNAECLKMATTTENATNNQSNYFMDSVSYSDLANRDAVEVVWMFIYQNPQYYFVQNKISMDYSGSNGVIYMCVYPIFADGSSRASVTDQFMTQVNTWVNQVKAQGSTYDKVKKAHDIVCDNVEYQSGDYDQTAYSAVLGNHETVCAGYTKTYELLCNAAGISATGSLSETHAWNQVKIGNEWYNVDTTWDDQDVIYYDFFLMSDATVRYGNSDHTTQSFQDGIIPTCPADYGYGVALTGVFLNKSDVTLQPGNSEHLLVGFTPSNTTETGNPTWTSSNKAVATVDGKGNVTAVSAGSAVVTATAGNYTAACAVTVKNVSYAVTFHENGHGSAPAAQTVEKGNHATDPGDLSEKGYIFQGWYTSASCNADEKWSFDQNTVTADVDLYAGWEAIDYGTYYATYENNTFYYDGEGKLHCYDSDANMVINQFKCDGTYTYFFQNDGSAMTDRLTYHPNGEQVIYFGANGHECFDTFVNVKKSIAGDAVDDICYFNTYGYMYVDTTTYDMAGVNLYYINPYGILQMNGWFSFSDGNTGYANADGTLMTSQFTYNSFGQMVYLGGDGHVQKGLITDGIYYYQMDDTDGHFIGMFPVN